MKTRDFVAHIILWAAILIPVLMMWYSIPNTELVVIK